MDVDVVIVGGGPTGVALANLLGAQGVSVLVAERTAGVLPIPRAVHIDGETMRAFQSMGLAPRMLDVLRPGGRMEWVDARGETLLVRTGLEGLGPQGWHNDYYFHQPELEAVLREGLARYPRVALRERLEVRGRREDASGVTLQAHDLARDEACEIRCRWVVGCDGARSIVRSWIGDEHEDLGSHQAWLVVDGVLEHPLDLPEYSVQHCDPARPATSIYVRPLRRRWEIMLMPGDDPAAITEPQRVWQLLEPWVRPTQARLERAATYTFHSLVARHWQRGRLLIAGDAAHQTPPFLGQGLCAGIRDASNLAWKLAAAVRHPRAGAGLLSTYGSERTPHAREFIALAVEVGKVIQVTDRAAAAERDARLKAQGMRFAFPTPRLGPGVHQSDHEAAGRIFMQGALPDGRWVDDQVGHRFALLLDARLASDVPAALRRQAHEAGVVVIGDPGQRVQAWLQEQGVAALVLRPDRYVFEVCRTVDEALASVRRIQAWVNAG